MSVMKRVLLILITVLIMAALAIAADFFLSDRIGFTLIRQQSGYLETLPESQAALGSQKGHLEERLQGRQGKPGGRILGIEFLERKTGFTLEGIGRISSSHAVKTGEWRQ